MMAKQVSARKTTFLKRKSTMKAKVPFDQMEVLERRTEPRKTEMRYFPQSIRKLISSTFMKNNKIRNN